MRFFVLFVFIINACNGKESGNGSAVAIDKISLTSLSGEPIDLSRYKGKALFINFWATWCKPCIEEMPTISNAMDSLKDEKIEFLFASDETAEQIEEFAKEHNHRFNYVKTNSLEELGIMGLPTTFVFDKNGKLVFNEMGYRKWDDGSNLGLLSKIVNAE